MRHLVIGLLLASCAAEPVVATSPNRMEGAVESVRKSRLTFKAQLLPSWQADAAELAFLRAARNQRRDLAQLYRLRGVAQPSLADLSRPAVTKLLRRGSPAYPEHAAALFYAHDEGELRTWLVDAEGTRAHARVALSLSAVDGLVATLRDRAGVDAMAIERGFRTGSATAPKSAMSVTEASEALASALLPPPILQGLSDVKHLIVIPTHGIGTIPFAILPLDGQFLIDRMTVSVASSLWDLAAQYRPWRAPQNGLVVGNPTMPKKKGARYLALPGSKAEAQYVARAVGTESLLGDAATESAVKGRMANADFIHLATHGLSRGENALDKSYLVLAAGAGNDGFFRGREIVQTRSRANLAVLSACQTGLGQVHKAGVIGLARAFQKAGVPRVVMSLWSVSDNATKALMSKFVDEVKRIHPAAALRKAMLVTRKRYPDPRHWGAFVLLGTPR